MGFRLSKERRRFFERAQVVKRALVGFQTGAVVEIGAGGL